MKYKLFKVTFNNTNQEFDIPTGWNMESVIYADDATVIVKLIQYEQVPSERPSVETQYNSGTATTWVDTSTPSTSWDVNRLVFNPGRGTSY